MIKYTAYLSPVAEYKLFNILDYIEEEFGNNSKVKFLKIFSESIIKIESNPFSCQETEFSGIYKSVVTKQTSFYYRIQNLNIDILTVTDNRQNPKKIYLELLKLQ